MNHHQAEIPIEGIEERLMQCAIPGYWGEVYIELHVPAAAAREVQFYSERKTTTQSDCVRQTEPAGVTSERVGIVRNTMSQMKDKLRLECPVAGMRALFKDGKLVSVQTTDVAALRRVV